MSAKVHYASISLAIHNTLVFFEIETDISHLIGKLKKILPWASKKIRSLRKTKCTRGNESGGQVLLKANVQTR